MKKQITPRQKSELARRKAMGVALIQKPLKFIKSRDNHRDSETGEVVTGYHHGWAKECADAGQGLEVQALAQNFL